MAPHATELPSSHKANESGRPQPAFVTGNHTINTTRRLRVAVIGAGLSGITAGALLPAKVPNIDLVIYDKNADVGGTWFENVYPGVRCDIPAHVYQSTFAPNSSWSEEFARGDELQRYWKDVAKTHGVFRYLKLCQKVTKLEWDSGTGKWNISITSLESGEEYTDTVDVVITAFGRFNAWRLPKYPGMHEYRGLLTHTSAWNPTFDPTGKRVAVIGNGASGIQVVPSLQKLAAHVDHYARSKTWIVGSWAGDVRREDGNPFTAEEIERWQEPADYLAHRKGYEDKYWRGLTSVFRNSEKNNATREDSIALMRTRMARKSHLVEKLIPDFSPRCRRPTPGPGYLEALCEDNVDYIQDPITRFTENGIITKDGTHREVDAVFCATGANVDLVPPFPIIANGFDLSEAWKPGNTPGYPRNYFGLASPGIPNLFFILGPQSSGLSGQIPHVAENQVAVIAKILRKIAAQGIKSIVPTETATDDFGEVSEAFFKNTVFTDNCSSWYNGGQKGGRIHGIWPGSGAHLTTARKDPRWEDWEYTYFSTNRFAYLGNGATDEEGDLASDMTHYLKLPAQIDLATLHE